MGSFLSRKKLSQSAFDELNERINTIVPVVFAFYRAQLRAMERGNQRTLMIAKLLVQMDMFAEEMKELRNEINK